MVEAIFIFLRYLTNLEEKGMEVIKCALKGGVYDYACLSLELARERVCPLLPKGREREATHITPLMGPYCIDFGLLKLGRKPPFTWAMPFVFNACLHAWLACDI